MRVPLSPVEGGARQGTWLHFTHSQDHALLKSQLQRAEYDRLDSHCLRFLAFSCLCN